VLALQEGVPAIERETWVSGQAQLDSARLAGPQEVIPVHIRLRPVWDDPFQDRKWPLQIRIQERGEGGDGATILGMNAFLAQSPATFGYLDRWLYLEDLRRAGILAPHTYFVRLVLNGEDWGLYALQEGISAEMLKSQQQPDSTLLRLDSGLSGGQGSLPPGRELDEAWDAPGSTLGADAGMDEFGLPQKRAGLALQQEQAAALALWQGYESGRLGAAEVFAPEQIGRYLAHVNLWGARDGLLWRQEWFAYNPLTKKLEPVGHDAFSGAAVDLSGYGLADLAHYNDLDVMAAYAREVIRIAQPGYLDELESTYGREFERVYLELAQEFASMDLELPWTRLPERQQRMLASLHPSQPAYAYQVTGRLDDTVHVAICNLLRYPLAVDVIQIGSVQVDVQVDWVSQEDRSLVHQDAIPGLVLRSLRGNVPRYVTLRIPADAFDASAWQGASAATHSVQFSTHVIGMDDRISVDVHRDSSLALDRSWLPPQPSVEQALERHPFLEADPSSTPTETRWLHIKPGSWQVDGDLVLPEGVGLQATQPVTLAFGRGAGLYARGPLALDGSKGEGIHLVPKDDLWGGILVVRAGSDGRSSLQNVEIRGTSGIQRGGLRTQGDITFYESPVTFDDCRIQNTHGETAVHIVHSEFELLQTQFETTAANALDADLAQGHIEQCSFHNIRGRGIDLIGSAVDIRDVDLSRVYGAGISATQAGVVNAESIRAANVHIPVVSQDHSSVQVHGMQIARAWTAGLAVYRDTPESGPARLRATQVEFQDDSIPALVQEQSSLSLNGRALFARELDVTSLDARQRTRAAMSALDFQFGSEIELIGYELVPPQVRPGEQLTLTLYWYALSPPSRDYTVFTHILDSAGQVAVGWDNMPCLNDCPTTQWRIGRLVDDVHLISLPAELPAGDYEVALGLYLLETGERLPVREPGGQQIPNATVLLSQNVEVRDE